MASTPSVVALRGITPLPEIATTVGKDFWVSFQSFDLGSTIQRKIFVTADQAGSVSLKDRSGTVLTTATLSPGAVASLVVPAGRAAPSGDGKSGAGLRVVSTVPASVYPAGLVDYASSGFQALPDSSLGTDYRVLGYTAVSAAGFESRLLVTATVDGTSVTITPKTVVGTHPAGVPFTVVLDAGQVYQFQSTAAGQDVTGTTVAATHPVAVVGGSACAYVPTSFGYCNPLTAQLPPVEAWGTTFVSGRFATRTKGDTYRVLANEDGTQVKVGGTLVATLTAGSFYEAVLPKDRTVSVNEAVVITTSKPALVAQYGNGQDYDGTKGDPLMTLVTPAGQHLTSYTVATPAVTTQNVTMQPYLSLVVQTRDIGKVVLDGKAVAADRFVAAAGTDYSVAQIAVATGQHTVTSAHQFGVTVYEWGQTDGFAFPGGSALAPIADAPAPPAPTNLASTGVGTAPQQQTVVVGDQQEVHLFDGTTTVDTVTVPQQGTYTLDPTTGVITFAPVLGFSGAAKPVTFRVRDAWNQQADATYTPTVTMPVGPTASALTSRARGAQSVAVTLPSGGSLTLLTGGADTAATSTRTVAGQGTYTVQGGTIAFTPLDSYDGTADAVTYQVSDAYGQKATSTYTPTALPPVPSPAPRTSGARGEQSVRVPVPTGGSLALLSDPADPTSTAASVTVDGQGTYAVEGETLSFTPLDSYDGTADAVTYQVTDGYGQTGASTYTATAFSAAPAPSPVTSRARGSQSVTTTLPKGGSLGLLSDPADPTSTVSSVTVPGQGTYSAKGETLSFTPLDSYDGTADAVTYQVTDGYGQTGASTYTATAFSAAPAPTPLTSQKHGVQSVSVTLPKGGSLALLKDATDAASATQSLTVAGQGTFSVEDASITFTPLDSYDGTADAVTYQVTDGYGQTGASTYTATAFSAAPAPAALTSRQRGVQSVRVSLPKGGSLALLEDASDPMSLTQSLTVAGQGTYTVEDATITFTPLETYAGNATAATYVVTDGYGQSGTSTYTPTALPVAPTAAPLTSIGEGAQSVQLTVPKGGTSVLVDGSGKETTQVSVPQGTYLLDVATATVSFVPTAGTSGTAAPLTYRVVDSFDQTADSTYTPTVVAPAAALPAQPTPAAPVVDPHVTLRLPALTRTAPGAKASVRTTCSTDVATIGSCRVRLWAKVKGQRTEIGSATTTAGGGASHVVQVRLNAVGRALVATPGGVPVTGELTLTTGAGATRTATAVGRVVARRFTLARAAQFAHASSTLSRADARYARAVSRTAGAVRVVTCTGYTDSSGGAELNERLGRERALTLCSALDLPTSVKVLIRTRGERAPEASNGTSQGRERNRRATITLRY